MTSIAVALFACCLLLWVSEAQAQTLTQTDRVPLARFGTMIGRDGAAFGPGLIVEANPFRFLGMYAFAGMSSVSGYETQGVVADFRDRTLGFGLVSRFLHVRRFTFGAFAQASYYGSHVSAKYPDGDGGSVEYRESDKDPLVAVGPEIECRIASGATIFVRPGKDFGNNFAASTAGGFSINAGVLTDGRAIARGFQRLFR